MKISARLQALTLFAVLTGAFTSHGFAQDAARVIRAEGAFLRGAGWYNLNTAKAESIQVNTMIRWKADLRRIAAEKRALQIEKEAGHKLNREELQHRLEQRDMQLRTNPTAEDVTTGQALNVLLYDLTDPDITSSHWASGSLPLPQGISVKDLIFQFTSSNQSQGASKALGRGLIALSRLDVAGDKWPTVMKQAELAKQRLRYEKAYANLRTHLIDDKFSPGDLTELDASLKGLSDQVEKVVPEERDFRKAGVRYVQDLNQATRMFDAATVDYAREILVDTRDHDATTVGELVAFMLKYRLQFASAGRSAPAQDMYRQLYEVLNAQAKAFNVLPSANPPVASAGGAATTPKQQQDSPFQVNSVWASKSKPTMTLTVTSLDGETFHAKFEHGKNLLRRLTGTYKGDKVVWLAKDVKAVRGKAGQDNYGVLYSAGEQSKIDVSFRDNDGKTHKYTLYKK